MKIGKKFTKGDILKGGGGSGGARTGGGGRSLWGMVKQAFRKQRVSKVPKIIEAKKQMDWGGKKKRYEESPGQVRKKEYMSEPEIKKRQASRVKEIETKKAEKLAKWETSEGGKKFRSDVKKIREKEKATETEKKRVKDIETDVEKDKYKGAERKLMGVRSSDWKKAAIKAALLSALVAGAKGIGPKEKEKKAKKILKKREEKLDPTRKASDIKYIIGGKAVYHPKDPYEEAMRKSKADYAKIYKMGYKMEKDKK